jgi:hypothetical protein
VISVKVPPTSMAIVPVSGIPAIVDESERHPSERLTARPAC